MDKNFTLPEGDIKLEVILAELDELGISVDDIIILRQSLFRRNFSREIEKVSEIGFHGRRKKIAFHLNREGIYDRLPQDLFHQSEKTGGKYNTKSVLDDIETQNNREKAARTFFLPYEQELNRMLLRLEWEERQFIFETNSDVSGELMGLFWDLPDSLDSFQRSKLGVIIPLLHRFGGDLDRVAFVLENISGYPVRLEKRPPLTFEMQETFSLGRARLGVDTLLGGSVRETQESIHVRVIARSLEDLDDIIEGGRTYGILEYLSGALLPVDKDVRIGADLGECAGPWILEEENPCLGRLEYTTIL